MAIVARPLGRAALALLVLSALPVAAMAAAQDPPRLPDFSRIGEPVLDNFEASVRQQLTRARASSREIVESSGDPVEQATALGRIGSLYLLYDFMEPAEEALRQAWALDDADFRWPYFLAVLYSYEGNFEGGAKAADRAAELQPDYVPAWLRAGDFHLELGNVAEAERRYRRALELDPESSAAHYGVGRIEAGRGEWASARDHFEKALESQPPGSIIHHHLGMAYRQLGDVERARAELAANQGERVAFYDPLMDALASVNVSRESLFSRGTDLMRTGRPDLALEAFQQVIALNPDDAEANYNVGMALVELGRKEEAERHLRRALELRDDYRDAHFNLGLMLGQKGMDAESERHLRRVVEIDPEDLTARVHWARALERLGRTEEALAELEEVVALDAAKADARLTLGTVLARDGRQEEAARWLRSVLELAPGAEEERHEAHLQLAALGSPLVSEEERLEHLEAAAELAPEDLDTGSVLAVELARRGRFDEAAAQYAELIERDPDEPRLHFGRAMALLIGGREAEAARALEAAVGRLPDQLALRHALARLLATSTDPVVRDGARALELAEAVMRAQLTFEHAETVAMALAELGRFEEAAALQQRVVDEQRRAAGAVDAGSARRLELYRQGQPVRAPWREAGP